MDKASLFKAAARRTEVVTITGLGDIEIDELDLAARQEAASLFRDDVVAGQVHVVCRGVSCLTEDDADEVRTWSPRIVEELVEAIMGLSRVDGDAVEDAAKN